MTGNLGYLGWPLCLKLLESNHQIVGIDNDFRSKWVKESNSESAIPILPSNERISYLKQKFREQFEQHFTDLTNSYEVGKIFERHHFDIVINLGSQPSAPFSMIDLSHALFTQRNNNQITMNILWAIKEKAPKCRLIHTSTMGEYGQPNFPIPEHSLRVNHKSRSGVIPLGRQPGSFYHASKVLDTHNIFLACMNWGISAQVLMTAVVYGNNTFIHADDSRSATRFDFDKYFGTVINRFVAQSMINHDITIYGLGDQVRAFISLEDFVESIAKVMDENIPSNKNNPHFMVYNQVTEYVKINELAELVVNIAKRYGSKSKINHIKNPRTEKEQHFYEVETTKFDKLRLTRRPMVEHIEDMIEALNNKKSKAILEKYKGSI